MKKQAGISPAAIKTILGAIAGGGAGAVTGYEVTPRLGGYEDVESARRSAALMHALTGLFAGGIVSNPAGRAAMHAVGPKGLLAVGPALIAEEALPMGLATMKRQQEASQAQTAAARSSSIPLAVQQALSGGTAKGMGAGVGVAGLAAILSGLARRQTQEEMIKRKTRGSMIGSDFLKFVLPAVVAGGVVGSLRKGNQNAITPGNLP